MIAHAFDQNSALQALMGTAKSAGISFEAYQRQIGEVLGDVYAEGVFLSSNQTVGTSVREADMFLAMNEQSALSYLLACCRRRGIIEFFVKGPITKLVNALYALGYSFVIGPGPLKNSLGG
jgi:hypothetical protein